MENRRLSRTNACVCKVLDMGFMTYAEAIARLRTSLTFKSIRVGAFRVDRGRSTMFRNDTVENVKFDINEHKSDTNYDRKELITRIVKLSVKPERYGN